MKKIVIDPITRIEGHLRVEVELDEQNIVKEAYVSGQLFRGLEIILQNREDKTKNYEIAIKRAFQLKESSFLLIDLDLYTKMGLIGQNVLIKTATKKQADFNEV